MTTKELLALVDKWRGRSDMDCYVSAARSAYSTAADELAPIATALCAEVEAQNAKLDGRTKSWELACENVEVERRRAEAAEAKVEALRKDAERLREALDGTVTLAEAWASYYARNYLGDISLTKEAWHATHKKIINEARAAIDAAKEPK